MRFVTAYISFMNNDLVMGEIEASSELKALQMVLLNNTGTTAEDWDFMGTVSTVEGVKLAAFDCDSMVSVYKISD